MSIAFIILIIFILVIVFVFSEVMITIGTAGYNPSKLLSDLFKKKTDEIELRNKTKTDGIAPARNEVVKEDAIEANDNVKVKEMVQRWRLIAGILFGLVMVFLLAFYRPGLMSGFYPWVTYAFWPLTFITVIAFIILRNKERKLENNIANPENSSTQKTNQIKYLFLVLSILTSVFIIYKIWDSDFGYAYRQYFFYSKDELLLDFNRLKPINMADVKKEFKVAWFCRKEQNQFGDFCCAAELIRWNNMPAMAAVFWYRDGILNYAKIDVPRWYHDEMIKYIYAEYGQPHSYSARANLRNMLAGTSAILSGRPREKVVNELNDLGIWQIDTGAYLVINVKKELNPFLWSTIFWISPVNVKGKANQFGQSR